MFLLDFFLHCGKVINDIEIGKFENLLQCTVQQNFPTKCPTY
jgi:hypothetical protein